MKNLITDPLLKIDDDDDLDDGDDDFDNDGGFDEED